MSMSPLDYVLFDKSGKMKEGSKGKVASMSKRGKKRHHHGNDNDGYGYKKNAGDGGNDAEG